MSTTFREYWRSLTPDQKQELSRASGIAYTTISNIANGHKKAGHVTIPALMSADSKITIEMLAADHAQQSESPIPSSTVNANCR